MKTILAVIPHEVTETERARLEETGEWPVREYDIPAAEPEALLIDAKEAARIRGCSLAALRKLVERDLLPAGCVKRFGQRTKRYPRGRRVMFVRAKLVEARGGLRCR